MAGLFRSGIGASCVTAVAIIAAVSFAPMSPPSAQAQTAIGAPAGAIVSDIAIQGNQRIERATILSYMTVAPGAPATAADVNESLKALYATGLFKDVRIDPRGSQLVVTVQENPVVNQIAFEGNDAIPDDALSTGIISRERRVFTRAKAETDAETILEAYRRSGRYAASVEPKIIELPQNRVDLVFEIEEGPSTGVDSIRFVGNTVFSDRRLRRVISTDESTWLNFLSATDSYDPDRLEYDKELLRRWYLSNGYIDFEVETAFAELSTDQSGFLITFTVNEGEQYRYGPTTVISNTEGVDPEELQQLVTMDEGSIYNIDEVEDTIQAITERLGEQGYAFTEIEPIPDRNVEAKTLGVTFEVNEGPRVFVERIDINGNVRTLDRVIRREFEIVEGDAFNALQLRRSRSNIRGLGFFSSVDVKTEQGSQPDRVIVTTEVEEQSTGQLSFGVGFSTSESVSGEVSVVERNLLGRGQYLRARARVSGSTTLYDLSFTEPAFLGRDVAAGFDLYRRETDNQDTSSFDLVNTGFRPRVSFPLGKYTRITPRYRISLDEVVDVPANASPLIQADIGDSLTSALGYELVHDRRNDPVTPSRGYILKLEQDVSGLGGDAEYFSTEGSAKIFRALYGEDVIGSFELAAGGVASYGDYNLKASDRYYLGGDSFRGFESAGLGPRDPFTGDTLGGNIYAVARTEVSFPLGLPEEYGLAGGVFADVGTLFRLDRTSYVGTAATAAPAGTVVNVDDDAEFRASVGATIFWTSPFGPIKLNFATPIVKQDGDEEEFFRFSAGTRF